MKQLLIILLFGVSFLCNAQEKTQPQFIKFMKKAAHPESELASYAPSYISTSKLTLPLPYEYQRMIEHEKKLKPTMSAREVEIRKQLYLRSVCENLIIDQKLFDVIHDYILRKSDFFVTKPYKPACLIVIDNKSKYLPQNNMRQFYNGLKSELLLNKCDIFILSKIQEQFTVHVE